MGRPSVYRLSLPTSSEPVAVTGPLVDRPDAVATPATDNVATVSAVADAGPVVKLLTVRAPLDEIPTEVIGPAARNDVTVTSPAVTAPAMLAVAAETAPAVDNPLEPAMTETALTVPVAVRC